MRAPLAALLLAVGILVAALGGTAAGAVSVYRIFPGKPAALPSGEAVVTGPALAGSLPATATYADGRTQVWLGDRELALPTPAGDVPSQISGSPRVVAVHLQELDKYADTRREDVVAGPPGQPLALVRPSGASSCYGQFGSIIAPAPTTVAATAGAVAFTNNCHDPVTIVDPVGQPGAHTIVFGELGFNFALAGDHLADAETVDPCCGFQIRVINRYSGELEHAYPVDFKPDWLFVDTDGTVLAAGYAARSVLLSPGQPTRAAPIPAGAVPAGLAGGRIAYVTASPLGVGVVELDGQPVASAIGHAVSGLGFDGTRISWADIACAAVLVGVWDLHGSPAIARPTRCGTPRASISGVRAGSRAVVLRLRCPSAAAFGCTGTVRLRSNQNVGIRPYARRDLSSPLPFRMAPSTSVQWRGTLRRRLPRRRSAAYRFRATIAISDPDGSTRTRTVTALLPRSPRR